MNHTLVVPILASLLLCTAPAQEPAPKPPAESREEAGGVWSEGYGRATSYRTALANALEDAVARQKGVGVARGAGIRSRLSVVSDHEDGDQKGWFDGEADGESEWVQQQIAGFVLRYEVLKRQRGEDRQWEVTIRALVAAKEALDSSIVIDLQDGDLRAWQLERFDEAAPGTLVSQQRGEFSGPKISEYLRRSRMLKIASKGPGLAVSEGSAASEREKAGHRLVPSHRVVITWQPVAVQSTIEKPNRARPTAGAPPEYLTGGSVQVSIRVDDLVEGTELLDETFPVSADPAASMPSGRVADYVNALVDKAKAIVAEKILFAVRPPLVVRKWQGEGGEWLVEAQVAKRVAAAVGAFAVGNSGSIADPDWQPLGRAVLVEGGDATCTFRLDGVGDPSRVEPNVTEVRPIRN